MTDQAHAVPAERPRKRGGLLRERDFRLFWFGETTSTVGTAISRVALPLVAVATLHVSTFGSAC